MSSIVVSGDTSGSVTLSAPAVAGSTVLTLPASTGTVTATASAVSAAGQIPFSTDGSTWSSTAKIVLGTAQASTSGASITFTGIPTWAKRVTLMLNGVSTNGTNQIIAQLGNGSAVTSGYSCFVGTMQGGGLSTASNTTGFAVDSANTSAYLVYGNLVFTLQTGNTWTCTIATGANNVGNFRASTGGGVIALAGSLDRVVLTSVGSIDTFDAGSINIMYE